ncbi:MAG: PfkB family carbohydrate kinase [Oceanipulchritudo sp.]
MMAVLKSAREAGCTISLDLASFEVVEATRDILPDILRNYVDLLFANEDEAATFTRGSRDDLAKLASELADYCELAVVKGGREGAWLARKGDEVLHVPAVPGITATDTTGAGDYWAAGFLTAWLRGKPLETCAAWGARLGAEIVQVIGAELPEDHWEKIVRELD